MALSDDELRAAYATLSAAAMEPHPDEALFERLACGELSADERLRLSDHVARCASCAGVWRGVQALRAEAERAAPRARVLRFPARAGWAVGLAAAAVLALAFLMPRGAGGPGAAPPPTDTLRSSGAADAPLPVSPRGQLTRAAGLLRWQALPGARAYRVQVLAADGTPLWTSGETRAQELAWPAGIAVAPGRYYWQVVAVGDAREERASELVDFEIAAR